MTQTQNQPASVPAKPEKGTVIYEVAGNQVKLSPTIVRNYLTKGDGRVTDTDITQFISICLFNKLNPFLNEAYLIKYGSQPAQMITSKEAYFKRAEANENYDGYQGGVIVQKDDEISELEGAFIPKGWTLVGGWAKIYRKDRKYPAVSRVNLDEYDKKKSTWNEKKGTMIAKVAKVQAMREAFPSQLDAMYTSEEVDVSDAEYEDISSQVEMEKAAEANSEYAGFEPDPSPVSSHESPQSNDAPSAIPRF